jgi:AAHS family 4-hydroxybenzoate transporter-like MFS transporter
MISLDTDPSTSALDAPARAARLSLLQWRVVLLCALVAFLDGFDTQAIGPAAKAIAARLSIPMGAFGLVFSASQVGFLIGAMVFSVLGDRFGRKRLLIAATATFAACSLGTALSGSFDTLIAFRFIAGLGLGGASPNFVSLASEYSPPVQRARVVTTLWAAVPLGGMVAAFASSITLPALGWQAIFIAGCAAPLLLTLALVWMLPESHEIRADTTGPDHGARAPAPITELFSEGRAISTIWLWLASFMTWTALIVMAFWTPSLLQKAGRSASVAASILAFNNAGGVVGTVVVGAMLTRVRPHHALSAALCLAGLFVAAMGLALAVPPVLAVAATCAGFFASAAGGAILAVSASAYPQDARATGVGWAIGFGRIGAVAGPIAIGLLIARNWPVDQLYLALAAPFLLAALFVVLLARSTPSPSQS